MKQLVQLKAPISDKQDIFLPQLRTKSMSIPTSKFHISYVSRYQDRKSTDYNIGSRNSFHKNFIINLQEIGKKAQDHANKIQAHSERKKILSQYQTIDLWKQKYSGSQQPMLSSKKCLKVGAQQLVQAKDYQSMQKHINEQRSIQEQKMFQLKKISKKNSLQLKVKKRQEKGKQRQMDIPDEVVVVKISEYQRLRKDDKLETILKKQGRQDEGRLKKSYKSSLPVFVKINISQAAGRGDGEKQEQNPSQWEYQHHDALEEEQF